MLKTGAEHLVAFLLVLLLGNAAAQPVKPDVYRHSDGTPPSGLDKKIIDAYRKNFHIIEITGDGYLPPKPIAGAVAAEAVSPSGETLTGHVLIAFLVTAEGRAAQPVIVESSDRRLNPYAIRSVSLWRFDPARFQGKKITTIAAQEFNFR